MPRRSGDGTKPFEFRTGVGGLPALGGMFRSGDPATIPPHKFHLLVNVRRTPGGTITRPGLGLVFDTGVQECIDGLTEDGGEQGGALMLYPGAEAGSNPATFRAIFPDSSIDYSEFIFALYGPAAAARGVNSPVLATTVGGGYVGPTWLSRPFLFRGQAVQFAMVDRSGTPTVALLGLELPQRSLLQASDCWRNEDGPIGNPACPGAAGQPTPSGLGDPPLWPFQHPAGSSAVLTYFDNPFVSGDWTPDCSSIVAGMVDDLVVAIAERFDDTLSGASGVAQILYFVAVKDDAGTLKRKLVRWDGLGQANEAVSIPDDIRPALGEVSGRPALAAAGLVASPGDWAATKGENGSWGVIGGAVVAQPPISYGPLLSWGGKSYLPVSWNDAAPNPNDIIDLYVLGPAGYSFLQNVYHDENSNLPNIVGAVVVGVRAYILFFISGFGQSYVVSTCLDLSCSPQTGLDPGANPTFAYTLGIGGGPSACWIQAVGGRVYIGGKVFFDLTNAAAFYGPGPSLPEAAHAVYDVTDYLFGTDTVLTYYVPSSDQPEDAVAERYSIGALPAVPNDDHGGEGFQAS